jgi:hypothetical protein
MFLAIFLATFLAMSCSSFVVYFNTYHQLVPSLDFKLRPEFLVAA